jgi:chromate transport protein ChrA
MGNGMGFFWTFSSIAILVALLVFLAIFVFLRGKKKNKPDYYALFTMGSIWLLLGFIINNQSLLLLGAVFTVTGLFNKDKWKENRKDFGDSNKEERKIKMLIAGFLTLLILLGLFVFLCAGKGI